MVHETQGTDHGQLTDAPHGEAEVVRVVCILAETARVEMLVLGVSIR